MCPQHLWYTPPASSTAVVSAIGPISHVTAVTCTKCSAITTHTHGSWSCSPSALGGGWWGCRRLGFRVLLHHDTWSRPDIFPQVEFSLYLAAVQTGVCQPLGEDLSTIDHHQSACPFRPRVMDVCGCGAHSRWERISHEY